MAETGATDYDAVKKIAIGPTGLQSTAKRLLALAQEVADALSRVQTTLNGLTSEGWSGGTQQEAEDFNRRWLAVMKELFGTEADPGTGVLNAIASGVGVAGDNYAKTESGLAEIWKKFSSNLPTAEELADEDLDDDGKKDEPIREKPEDVLDTNKTAITADY
ncbi:WXG100 family type VII secretion target [Actinomadura darangshiensis]|uniref:WXG100 family type VII secretion target n=1 Tax=Actinomadura darangshiensis TaxID=705336 RepID=UPI0014098E8D|nr:WXG100 family type VII secretion target [Actinomadura darangshiensis]